MASDEVPVVDMTAYMEDPTSEAAKAEIAKVAVALRDYGALVIKVNLIDCACPCACDKKN